MTKYEVGVAAWLIVLTGMLILITFECSHDCARRGGKWTRDGCITREDLPPVPATGGQ